MTHITAVKFLSGKHYAILDDGTEIEVTQTNYFRIRAGLDPLAEPTPVDEVATALANFERNGTVPCKASYLAGWLEAKGYDFTSMVNELTYACYAYNRQQAPHIAPERWTAVFGDEAVLFEYRYQAQ